MLMLKPCFIVVISTFTIQYAMAQQDTCMIDDRSSGNLTASSGNEWRLVTDEVMGGISNGRLKLDTIEQRPCLHMQGDVKLDNNGGFVQIALDLSDQVLTEAADYQGITFDALGNDEAYNIHLRSDDLRLPWQSYRATFRATHQWQTIRIPFSEFEAYRTTSSLDVSALIRVGFVAIGRAFSADLCITNIALYR